MRGMRLEITLSDFQKFIVMAMMEYLWGDKKMPGQEVSLWVAMLGRLVTDSN